MNLKQWLYKQLFEWGKARFEASDLPRGAVDPAAHAFAVAAMLQLDRLGTLPGSIISRLSTFMAAEWRDFCSEVGRLAGINHQ